MTDQYTDSGNDFDPLAVAENTGLTVPTSWYAADMLRSGKWNTLPESVQSALSVETAIIFGGIGTLTESCGLEVG